MTNYDGLSAEHLRQFIERIERLEIEKQNLVADIKEVKSEAKANGFDVKAINEILKLRKKNKSEIEEEEYILDTYKRALGMIEEIDD